MNVPLARAATAAKTPAAERTAARTLDAYREVL